MKKISKREFLKISTMGASGFFCFAHPSFCTLSLNTSPSHKREAMFYVHTARGIKCTLCPNECTVKTGDVSICHNRMNENNTYYSMGYGNPCGVNIDPVEKKPLYHYLPGSTAYSLGVAGCNFACLNCLNWQYSQRGPDKTQNIELMPGEAVKQCLSAHCRSMAYTYTEPTTFYEYMYDTASLSHQKSIRNIYVSNGYINEVPLQKLCSVIDAATIDIKAFDDTIYQKLTAGTLQPVLNSLKTLKSRGIWVEISNLIVPGWTDHPGMIRRMCDWLAKNGFSDHPLHFIRFLPMYKLSNLAPTPLDTLLTARDIAHKAGFSYVYIGNVPGEETENTVCPVCHKTLIRRKAFTVLDNDVIHGKCRWCGHSIPGIWS